MKLTNFILEGKSISLIARLGSETRSVRYDIVFNDKDALHYMNDAELAEFKKAMEADLCDLENGYETTYLLALFRGTWKGGAATNGNDREESGHALRKDTE